MIRMTEIDLRTGRASVCPFFHTWRDVLDSLQFQYGERFIWGFPDGLIENGVGESILEKLEDEDAPYLYDSRRPDELRTLDDGMAGFGPGGLFPETTFRQLCIEYLADRCMPGTRLKIEESRGCHWEQVL
ncbi:MAG: hypothetical protein AAF442_05300 [Pseudomonadota bacterium]